MLKMLKTTGADATVFSHHCMNAFSVQNTKTKQNHYQTLLPSYTSQ